MEYRTEKLMRENPSARGLLKSMGYSEEELGHQPRIGIANSWNGIVPGHYNLRDVSEHVKRGIYAAGGTPLEFGTIALCDGLTQGHIGMSYVLPSREIIADSVETMVQANQLDGLVALASCDKIIPGMLLAAARLNIPFILINGGPMIGGKVFDGRKSDNSSVTEAWGMHLAGKCGYDVVENLLVTSCQGCGSCSFYGTANTMGAISEALGCMLTGGAEIPAVFAQRFEKAYDTGKKIVELVERGITARQIITKGSIENAIRVCLATGASTNAVLHLSALAVEADIDMDVLGTFKTLNKTTPQIARPNPNSKWDMEDYYYAGGTARVMQNLSTLLNLDVMTVNGCTLAEALPKAKFWYDENPEILTTLDKPFSPTGGIAVLEGNLAPCTGISKPSAIAPEMHHFVGKAICFDSEEEAECAIRAGKVQPGHVVVVRYEGPKGGPGMREMCLAMKLMYGMGLHKCAALITDGRFSGTNNGCFVGHISPEAAEGGPIALIEDGDEILIDVDTEQLELHVDEATLVERRKAWKRPEKNIPAGYLQVYAETAASADKGAVRLRKSQG